MAGKHQGNVFASLMSNFDTAREALEVSANSSGSAMKEHAKWSESLEARLLKLQAAWQSLSQSFMNSSFLKSALDGVISLVDGIDKLISTVGLLPAALTAFTAFKSFNGKGFFKVIEDEAALSGQRISSKISKSMSNIHFNNLGIVTNANFRNSLNYDIAALTQYQNAVNNGMSTTDALNQCMGNASLAAREYAESGKLAANGVLGFENQQKAAQVTLIAQNNTLSSAKAIIKEYNSGCRNTAMSQTDFVTAVKSGNSVLGNYLIGLNGAKAGMAGYVASLVGAKVASIALQAATIALNMALTMGVSVAITAAIKAFDKWIETSEELEERLEEVTSKYKEQIQTLRTNMPKYDTSNEESLINRYAELSKGVNALGENVSLTSEEYDEYRSIVGTIADDIPSMVSGFNSQGDAILDCAGDVNTLSEAYKNLIIQANNEVLKNGGDFFKDFKNNLHDLSTYESGENPLNHLNILEDIISSGKDFETAISELDIDVQSDIADLLENSGYFERDKWTLADPDNESYEEFIIRALKEDVKAVKSALDESADDINSYAEELGLVTESYLSTEFLTDYSNMSDRMQSIINQIASGFDSEFYGEFLKEDDPFKSLTGYLDGILKKFDSLDDEETKELEAAFDLKTKFNGGEISYGEYVDSLTDVGGLIDKLGLDEEIESNLKLSLGLNEDNLVEDYETLSNRLLDITAADLKKSGHFSGIGEAIKMASEEVEGFIDSLSSEELSVLMDIIPELDAGATIEEIREALERAMIVGGLTFDLNLEVESAGIEAVNTALTESVSATGLSSESIAALKDRYAELESQGYNLSSMFEETSNGIHLNKRAVSELEQAYAKQKLNDVNGDLTRMKEEYDELGEEINNCGNSAEDAAKKASLFSQRQSLAKHISEAATLAAQYEGLASAYKAWQDAESGGNERDMYEGIIGGFKTVEDELSRGWMDRGTREFIELITGETATIVDGNGVKKEIDIATASAKELKQVFDDMDKIIEHTAEGGKGYSISDFFTTDEDGNVTADGVYNFWDAIGHMEEEVFEGKDVVKRDKNNNVIGFDIELAGGTEAIAEALGISEELVEIMIRASEDAGFVVSMDGTYAQLADLENEAVTAVNHLKEIGKVGEGVEFDFNTSDVESLNTQLNEAHKILDDPSFWNSDGTFNIEADGAEQAMTIVSTLQAKLDFLSQENYGIGLTVEDEEFEEPLANLQEYGEKIAVLNQLELNPKANAKEIQEIKADLGGIVREFNELPDEKKVELGLVDESGNPLTDAGSIREKIESGEIKIPTTLDIQANMDKNIEDLKNIALLGTGKLSEEQENKILIELGLEVEVDEEGTKQEAKEKVGKSIDKLNEELEDKDSEPTVIEQDVEIEGGETDTSKLQEDVKEAAEETNGELEPTQITQPIEFHAEVEGEQELHEIKALVDDDGKVITYTTVIDGQVKELEEIINEDGTHTFKVKAEVDDSSIKEIENIEDIEDINVKAFANVIGAEDVSELKEKINSLEDKHIEAIAKVFGQIDVEKLKEAFGKLNNKTIKAIAKALGKGDVDGLKSAIDKIPDENVKKAIAEAFGFDDVESLKTAIGELNGKTVEAIAEALGIKNVNSLKDAVDRLEGKDVEVVANTSGQTAVDNLRTAISNLKDKTVNIWTRIFGGDDVNGTANANGTAYASGTINSGRAFKRGDWRTKKSETALTGELGQELVVVGDHWYTVGDNGAEFANIPKGAIVFNHRQTEELFKNGKITSGGGRGKITGGALARGTAYNLDDADGYLEESWYTPNSNNSKSAKTKSSKSSSSKKSSSKTYTKSKTDKSNSKSKSDSKDFEETFDWIEIAISRIERSIDRLDTKANSTWRSWSERNKNLAKEIKKVEKEIELQRQAYNRYKKERDSVDLDSKWKKKVRQAAKDGYTIDLSTIKDEDLANKIKEYQEWHEKMLECEDTMLKLYDTEAEKLKERFDNVSSQYDGILQGFEHTENMLNEYIAQEEAKGHIVSEQYYNALKENEKNKISNLQSQQSKMLNAREKYVKEMIENGMSQKDIENSETWKEMCADIDSVTQEIEKCNTNLIEFGNNAEEANKKIYELSQQRFSRTIEEADFLTELLGYEDLHDDNGKLTDAGMSKMGLHGQKQNTYMYKADAAFTEAERLKTIWDSDKNNKDAETDYYNAIAEGYDYILKSKQEEEEMINLIKEANEIELDALQERIDKYEESLDSAKDLYEYQKKMNELAKEAGDIEKQIIAYEGDDSEEARAKIQELRVSLDEAKQNIEEQQYDKYISDQKALLDDLYIGYEQILNERLDNQDALLGEIRDCINLAASTEGGIATTIGTTTATIGTTLTTTAKDVGTVLSTEMQNIWVNGDGSIKSVLTKYDSDFNTKTTTVITTLNGIKTGIDNMVIALNKEASKNVNQNKTTTSAKKDPTDKKSTTSNAGKTTGTQKSTGKKSGGGGGNGKVEKGEKVKYESGKYYYDSYGKKPLGSKHKGESVYVTNINKKGSYPYHISTGKKLGKGDLGWVKKKQISGYASGKMKAQIDELAWTQEQFKKEFIVRPSDGAILTPVAKGDSILNANATRNIWDMANSPAEFIRESLNLGNNMPNNSNIQNSYNQTIENVVFSMPNVQNYNELLSTMQRDKNFEKLILSMSIDRIAGKSSLAKGKVIR